MPQKKGSFYVKETLILALVLVLYWGIEHYSSEHKPTERKHTQSDFLSLVDNKISGEMVEASAKVYKTLPDDTVGDKHQRFLVEIDGVSVLIAHNIDLAPRVPVKPNDVIQIKGQYEWNEKGGVIHWTHHDPRKKHEEGWIISDGKKFN